MLLYTTELLIENVLIPYQVFKEGSRIFFKPVENNIVVNAPIFWVARTDGSWKPINIDNDTFLQQVQEDILKHNIS